MKPIKRIKPLKSCIIGVDEAGRGSWAGPVVAACVCWTGRCPIRNILRDSKKMQLSDREKTFTEILMLASKGKLSFGIGIISSEIIDTVGIREANRLAMQDALLQVQSSKSKVQNDGSLLKIDGRDNYSFDIPGLPKPEYIVRGDSKIKQIMAASILAKVTRDKLMTDFESLYIGYGFAKHKGYGTKSHHDALKSLGVSDIHRKSYRPILELLNQ